MKVQCSAKAVIGSGTAQTRTEKRVQHWQDWYIKLFHPKKNENRKLN